MRMNQVTIGCTDYAASVLFYRQLGLTQIVDSPPQYARFETPGRETMSVHQDADIAGGGSVVYFECDDLDDRVARLKASGVTFDSGPQDMPWLWREARLRDPAGNRICLYRAGSNRRFPPWRINAPMPGETGNTKQASLEHVNISVSDPERLAQLFCDLFGWHIRWQGPAQLGGHSIHVGSDSNYIAVYCNDALAAAPPTFAKGAPMNHIGITVDDLDAVERRVRAAGLEPFNHDDYEPGRRFYFFDWNGIEFEIISYA
jgi:catechol 2,3-dioxygenase-like lactoylglutathione lyase family enzyme